MLIAACIESLGTAVRSIYSRTRSLKTAASTTPEQVTIAVDRALMARESGYVAMAHEEISHALSLAENSLGPMPLVTRPTRC